MGVKHGKQRMIAGMSSVSSFHLLKDGTAKHAWYGAGERAIAVATACRRRGNLSVIQYCRPYSFIALVALRLPGEGVWRGDH
jgi:hypothetical protein